MSEIRSYHGQPVLKEPVWTWEIPCYFFTGGVAGGSAGLAFLAGARGNDVLARRAWAAALAGVTASPALLISDLGRPERFFNMLRMFKVTSPMSVGSWVLSASGAATALAAANAWTGAFPRSARLARPAAALLGLPLSTYTAALIADTAVPAWHAARRELPFVFASGAALSAGAAAVIATPPELARPARRLALATAAAEVGTTELMKRRLGELGEPYHQGEAHKFGRLSQAGIGLGAALLASRGGRSRAAAVAAGVLLGAGALSARWSVFKAGFRSASDPRYVVAPQREGIDRGDRRGAARRGSRLQLGARRVARVE
ncbi:MAG TPA: NrfD/PsrC family molybdoenzyme membrane anchor subunit [Solirubrobacteraceae bacterium]|nr:NrfD/PsrC family molybdoenzyme membrane anchor subunit [Solirubrobacteraceae bacterium]